MKETIYTKEIFIQELEISAENLREWEKHKLLKPFGFSDDKTALYSTDEAERVEQIKKFQELGYTVSEIQKIIRKIGLPKSRGNDSEKKELRQFLTVGNLAERVGVSPRTIKHWENKGIIEPDMRSEGGFRLYSEFYVEICRLVLDLQLFGYSLDAIKTLADEFRSFYAYQLNQDLLAPQPAQQKLNIWSESVSDILNQFMLFKKGIQRWEDLLKKKKKELRALGNQNQKRIDELAKDKGNE
ncbi:MerR family transcriptional regulator [bacterium]|nr:MerR family transcriptional regulator [bacterium]